MGFKTFGFGGGRATSGNRKSSTGGRKGRGLATNATAANASCKSLGAVQMGLIYVNPRT
jgi:catalase (peroxidase I)